MLRNPFLLALVLLMCLAVFLLHPAKQIHADRSTPLPSDLSPGLRIAASPYAAPLGCPVREWSVDEYLPAACVVGHRLDRVSAERAALEWPYRVGKTQGRRKWLGFRQREWIRAGDDALLVTRPTDSAGRILHVAKGRFGSSAPSPNHGADYRRPPMDYILRAGFDLLCVPIVGLIVVGLILVYRPIRPPAKASL